MKYVLKRFWAKLGRGIGWLRLSFTLPAWNEYDTFIGLQEHQLIKMAEEFEKKDITQSAASDAVKMRFVAKLLKMYRNEHYQTKALDEEINPEWEFSDDSLTEFYRDGENSRQKIQQAYYQDRKLLHLAYKLMAHHIPGWWM